MILEIILGIVAGLFGCIPVCFIIIKVLKKREKNKLNKIQEEFMNGKFIKPMDKRDYDNSLDEVFCTETDSPLIDNEQREKSLEDFNDRYGK